MEINVRRTVFYPEKTGINYITVRGFILRDAATPWAPPTAEQIGLIGTHWSKGWIIENNESATRFAPASRSANTATSGTTPRPISAEGYVKTIERALPSAGQRNASATTSSATTPFLTASRPALSAASGAVFSAVTGNTIHDIHVRQLFSGAEMAGIKFHAAIDVVISHNHILPHRRGLWLDWMAQGTRVSGNLFHDNRRRPVCRSGPRAVPGGQQPIPVGLAAVNSQGGAFVHNLFAAA